MKAFFHFVAVVAAIGFSSNILAANLKESICYIKKSEAANSNGGEHIVKVLQENSYLGASKKLKQYIENQTIGSGFVVKDKQGKLVVVTNKHVVGPAKYVDLNFEVNGAVAKYSRCPVTATSSNTDIAIVSFPSSEVSVPALNITSERPKDGTEVWTAGFPALDNAPSWQLGKGIVSNNSVRNEYFGNIDSVSVIQHTAQVDAGSSGGPLLIKKENDEYEVVGINTWKAYLRENANFSIPIKEIETLSQRNADKQDNTKSIENAAKNFLSDAQNSSADLSKYISDEMVLSMDGEAFTSMLKKSSATRRSDLRTEDPMPVLKAMVADCILRQYDKIEKVEFAGASANGNEYKSSFSYKGNNSDIMWRESQEGMQIVGTSEPLDKIVENANYSSSVIFEPDWTLQLEFGTQLPASKLSGTHYEVVPMLTFGKFGLLGWGATFGWNYAHYDIGESYYEGNTYVHDTCYVKEKERHIELDYRMGAQCPIALGKNRKQFVMPFILGSAGYHVSGGFNYNGFKAGYHIGLKYGVKTKKVSSLLISAEYYRKVSAYWDDEDRIDDDGCDLKHHGYLGLHFGIGF